MRSSHPWDLCQVLREIEALEDRSSGGIEEILRCLWILVRGTRANTLQGEQLLDCQLLKMQRKTEILEPNLQLVGELALEQIKSKALAWARVKPEVLSAVFVFFSPNFCNSWFKIQMETCQRSRFFLDFYLRQMGVSENGIYHENPWNTHRTYNLWLMTSYDHLNNFKQGSWVVMMNQWNGTPYSLCSEDKLADLTGWSWHDPSVGIPKGEESFGWEAWQVSLLVALATSDWSSNKTEGTLW